MKYFDRVTMEWVYKKNDIHLQAMKNKVSYLIRSRMEEQRITVTELAKKIGVGRPCLYHLINGKSKLSIEMAHLLYMFFKDLNPRELLREQLDAEIADAGFKPNK